MNFNFLDVSYEFFGIVYIFVTILLTDYKLPWFLYASGGSYGSASRTSRSEDEPRSPKQALVANVTSRFHYFSVDFL